MLILVALCSCSSFYLVSCINAKKCGKKSTKKLSSLSFPAARSSVSGFLALSHLWCCCRKRKSPDGHARPTAVRMMWNFDAETTDAMMKDVGVSLLKSDDLINGRSSAWSSSQSAVDSVQSNVRESVFCVSLVNGSRFINVAVEYF